MLNDDCLEQVITKLHEVSNDEHASETNIPEDRIVKKLVNILFQSSLHQEEGVYVKPSVVFIPREKLEDIEENQDHHFFQFVDEIPFTESKLSKLSRAFEAKDAYLVVTSREDDQLSIEGSFYHIILGRDRLEMLNSFSPHEFFALNVSSPGSVILTFSDKAIGRVTSKGFTPAMVRFSSTNYHIGDKLHSRATNHEGYERYGNNYWLFYRSIIERLILEAYHRGHGGTIALVPESLDGDLDDKIEHRYLVSEFPQLENYLRELCWQEYEENPQHNEIMFGERIETLRTKKRIQRSIDFLSQLTTIDGALIIDDKFNVFSFGSFFKVQNNDTNVISPSFESPKEEVREVNLDEYGTRHNSAVKFASSYPPAVIFVISEDGQIAGISQIDDDTVYWWPDCSKSLFAHELED